MFIIDSEAMKEARGGIFCHDRSDKGKDSDSKSINKNECYITIAKDSESIKVMAKMPHDFESKVMKKNKTAKTEQMFFDNGERGEPRENDGKELKNEGEYYQGCILPSDCDDINKPLFIYDYGSGKMTINMALLRVKGISDGLVLRGKGKLPLMTEAMIKESIVVFKKRLSQFYRILESKVDLKLYINGDKEELRIKPYEFKIGDRVRMKPSEQVEQSDFSDYFNGFGVEGEVVDFKGGDVCVGVKFDEDINGHNLNGSCENGFGQWIEPDALILIEKAKEKKK